ncbi:tRNA (adenosine(37)-N6)-threonylcarbamoyltransferase complex dimerization subunit type 1 TsaB [Terriglobus sp. TAA 43]|uniref:tRNA (adenosine(37)-N6)-threonylcarbamoyltransferase complex dimerization subunit type 1 TsaB n=1 Tax=Terriglobus sp. TAA 43 TaxID=278961 RepID=UPI0006903E53|nr:tRNA (adenosine(37)-N6)-threonylcarbamoyltransferase complex dimerization subunit type 1 TsaB [Terriglobus sp. TAA 43]
MAWLLLLDTCGEGGGVGLARVDGATAALVAERSLPGRETQERLMVALDEVFGEAGVTGSELDAIAVVHGPGSFTGVRIGLAAAKGLADALDVPLIAISRLESLASRWFVECDPESLNETVQAWLDAGRGDVFVGRYRGSVCEEEVMLPGAAAVARVGDAPVVVMEDRLAELLSRALRVSPVGVREALGIALRKYVAGEFADTALLDANYLRVPDAELALRARQCG